MSEQCNCGEFLRRVSRAGRNHGPALLWEAWVAARIDQRTLAAVIGDVWQDAEFPERYLGRQAWLFLFESAGYTVNGRPAPRPSESVALYRGAIPHRAHGMAWTADLERARWFAQRFAALRPAFVYATIAPPGRLLARIHDPVKGRGEDEFVIDAAGLAVRRCREAEAA